MTTENLRRTASLHWIGQGLQFEGTTGSAGPGLTIPLDGDSTAGASPMELLLLSLGGCMAIDLRVILERSRVPLTALTLELEGTRAGEVPKRYESIGMHFRLTGPDQADRSRVERAIQLSEEKYCSVYHTLRPDLQIRTTFELA